MPPFVFSLQRVLDIRQQQEEQARLEVAKAQIRYQDQVARTEQRSQALQAHMAAWREKSQKGVNNNDLWLHQTFAVSLERDVQEAESLQIELAKNLNAKRRELVQRAKETKLLEKLKERQGIRHAEEEAQQERHQLDEMSTIRFRPSNF